MSPSASIAEVLARSLPPHRITLPADPGLRARVLALSEGGHESWDERAAIAEYDGNLPRGEAERPAYARILRGRGP